MELGVVTGSKDCLRICLQGCKAKLLLLDHCERLLHAGIDIPVLKFRVGLIEFILPGRENASNGNAASTGLALSRTCIDRRGLKQDLP